MASHDGAPTSFCNGELSVEEVQVSRGVQAPHREWIGTNVAHLHYTTSQIALDRRAVHYEWLREENRILRQAIVWRWHEVIKIMQLLVKRPPFKLLMSISQCSDILNVNVHPIKKNSRV